MRNATDGAAPRFQQVKDHIAAGISQGRLRPGDRLPSETDLVRDFAVSRMTAGRALKELETEGLVARVQGVGSFVAKPRQESAVLEIRDIALEVRERGQRYRCEPLQVERSRDAGINRWLGLPVGAVHFRSRLLHRADEGPVQLEDRFVNPAFAPHYLDTDFATTTPYQALMALAALQGAEHVFRTRLPEGDEAALLGIGAGEPCLVLCRRTWSRDMAASVAILIAPGDCARYAGQIGTLPPRARRLPPL